MSGNVDSIKFAITAGMTPDDVRNSEYASEEQKTVAFLFDTDGIAGYSQAEADAFNNATIRKNGKKYSVWTQNDQGEEREIKYKEDKYIKTTVYNGKWANSDVKQVWDKDKEDWRTVLDCKYENGYIRSLYYSRRHGKIEITENFRDPMVLTDRTVTRYYNDGRVKNKYVKYNQNGKM